MCIGQQKQDAERVFRLCLDTLDKELLTLLRLCQNSTSVVPEAKVEDHQVSQLGQAEVENGSSVVRLSSFSLNLASLREGHGHV